MIPAAHPAPRASRILKLDARGAIRHAARNDLAALLRPGDLVVGNDAATMPASLSGRCAATGAPVELRLAGWGSSPVKRGRGTMRSMVEGAAAAPGLAFAPSTAFGGPPPPSQATWEEPDWGDPTRFVAVLFGAGDFRTRTEDRPPPPRVSAGDTLALEPLIATVERMLGHPRLLAIRFAGAPKAVWAGIARHGRPIQYAHVPEPLALPDVWTGIAARPLAFETPSAGFALDWQVLAAFRRRGIGFTTLTLAAGLSSTGDPALDRELPFDEPFHIPAETAAAIARARKAGGRVIAIGTTVVRALEAAALPDGKVASGDGVATGRIGPTTRLRVADAILTGIHAPGESHYELLRAFADDAALASMADATEALGYRNHEFGDFALIERMPKRPVRRTNSRCIESHICAGAADAVMAL